MPIVAVAQKPLALSKPEIEYAEPFTQISGIRELKDGRVLVSDTRDKTLQLIDFKAGAATKAIKRDLEALRDQFPAFIPPFQSGGLIAGGDGNLWLQKQPSMQFVDARYDVVDRRSRLIGTLALAKGERIVSVSRTAVYIVWKDDDDIERLRRHPWAVEPIKAP